MVWILSARRDRRLDEAEHLRVRQRMAREDLAALDERLAGGSRATLDQARADLGRARTLAALETVEAVLSRAFGRACYFDRRHGPAAVDLPWTPPGAAERLVPMCQEDEARVRDGVRPRVRMVRVGDDLVPWWTAAEVVPVRRPRRSRGPFDRGSDRSQRYAEVTARIDPPGSAGFG